MSIGEKLRAIDEHAGLECAIPGNESANRKPAERSPESGGGISNRPLSDEQDNQQRVPPRGESKEGGHA